MKPLTLAGAILTAFGIIALLFASGIRYTSKEKFPRDSSTQVVVKQEKVVSIPPAIAGLAVIGGFALMVLGARK